SDREPPAMTTTITCVHESPRYSTAEESFLDRRDGSRSGHVIRPRTCSGSRSYHCDVFSSASPCLPSNGSSSKVTNCPSQEALPFQVSSQAEVMDLAF